MPRPAAPHPGEWATTRDRFDHFEIDELNRVVHERAFIELALAKKRSGRSLFTRMCARVMFFVAAIGMCAPAIAIGIMLSGGGRYKFSEDFSVEFETLVVHSACVLGAMALLYFFVPWVGTPHRQWDRATFAAAAFLIMTSSGLLVFLYVSEPEAYRDWSVTLPVWFLLLLAVATIVAMYRLRNDAKPPAVDLGSLTPEEMEVLLKSRRDGLVRLRSRGIITYEEFAELDKSPLEPHDTGGA